MFRNVAPSLNQNNLKLRNWLGLQPKAPGWRPEAPKKAMAASLILIPKANSIQTSSLYIYTYPHVGLLFFEFWVTVIISLLCCLCQLTKCPVHLKCPKIMLVFCFLNFEWQSCCSCCLCQLTAAKHWKIQLSKIIPTFIQLSTTFGRDVTSN